MFVSVGGNKCGQRFKFELNQVDAVLAPGNCEDCPLATTITTTAQAQTSLRLQDLSGALSLTRKSCINMETGGAGGRCM